jgi:dihydroorotase
MNDMVLQGGLVLTPSGARVADVAISEGKVVAVGEGLEGEQVLHCRGAWVGPGFVDLHTHLREPGQEWKEDIDSGSAAAAAGGYTAVVAMPNTDPPIDSGHLARYVTDRGRGVGLVEVASAGCVTMSRSGERLAHLDELWDAGVRMFSDDGDVVADAGLMRRALEYAGQRGGVIAQHAVDAGLAAGGYMNEGPVSSLLGMYAIPGAAEDIVIARDLALVELTGARYHVQHVATARGVELIAAAKERGLPVTAEVTPHHLAFDDTAVAGTDPAFKMMPPLRSTVDVAAIREGLRAGVIDVVATDHAPHASHEKDVPFEEAPFGVIGLEWAGAVVNEMLDLDPVTFFERMSVAPAAIAGFANQGRWVEPGAPASLAVFDPAEVWVASTAVSRSQNAPYLDRSMRGSVRFTVFGGVPTARDRAPLAGVR